MGIYLEFIILIWYFFLEIEDLSANVLFILTFCQPTCSCYLNNLRLELMLYFLLRATRNKTYLIYNIVYLHWSTAYTNADLSMLSNSDANPCGCVQRVAPKSDLHSDQPIPGSAHALSEFALPPPSEFFYVGQLADHATFSRVYLTFCNGLTFRVYR